MENASTRSSELKLKNIQSLVNNIIDNKEIFNLADKVLSDDMETINADLRLENVQAARRVFLPSSLYGTSLALNKNFIIDIEAFGGSDLDFFSTDEEGIIKNCLHTPSTKERVEQAKKTGKKIIMIFGGSTIMGIGSRIPNLTIPALVESILRLEHNIDAVCINRGVIGYTSIENLNLLLTSSLHLQPDEVIFYDGWNCVSNFAVNKANRPEIGPHLSPPMLGGMSYRHYEHDKILFDQFQIWPQTRRLLWVFCNKLLQTMNQVIKLNFFQRLVNYVVAHDTTVNQKWTSDLFEKLAHSDSKTIAEECALDYLRIHNVAEAFCSQQNISFSTFLQPCLSWGSKPLTPKETVFHQDAASFNKLNMEFHQTLQQSGEFNKFCDLADCFNTVTEQCYIDSGHLNPTGNFHVAKKIATHIASNQT